MATSCRFAHVSACGVVIAGGLDSYKSLDDVPSVKAPIGIVPGRGGEGQGCARTSLSGPTLNQKT